MEGLIKQKIRPANSIEKAPNWVRRAEERKDLNSCANEVFGFKENSHNLWMSGPVTNIAVIIDKALNKYYLTMEDFLIDIEQLMKSAFGRCENKLALSYVSGLYHLVLSICADAEEFLLDETKNELDEIYSKLEAKEPSRIRERWEKKAIPRREYYLIEEYVPGIEGDRGILDRMRTKLRGSCDGRHCLSFEKLGPLSLEEETWVTECKDRRWKVECDREKCGCKLLDCKNRAITDHKIKRMGVDVKEIESWGLDAFAIKLIALVMPKNIPKQKVSEFIEFCLIRALQSQGKFGWNIKLALDYIMHNNFTPLNKQMAKHLLKVVELNRKGIEAFKVYSKGVGVVCCSSSGFRRNELINEYYGEIYPPWRWYEKQDIIKKGQNEGRISQDLPDFYNITLEKHKYDPDGYDVLVLPLANVVCGPHQQRRLLQPIQPLLQPELFDGGDGG